MKQKIAATKQELAGLEETLRQYQQKCQHDWGQTMYTPIVREGYQDPGDGPDWHGADKRFPTWVPREEKPRWTRECKKCCLVETTSQTNEHVTVTPRF
jgi:hypothetical protein